MRKTFKAVEGGDCVLLELVPVDFAGAFSVA
jgi:hypothetical protein